MTKPKMLKNTRTAIVHSHAVWRTTYKVHQKLHTLHEWFGLDERERVNHLKWNKELIPVKLTNGEWENV